MTKKNSVKLKNLPKMAYLMLFRVLYTIQDIHLWIHRRPVWLGSIKEGLVSTINNATGILTAVSEIIAGYANENVSDLGIALMARESLESRYGKVAIAPPSSASLLSPQERSGQVVSSGARPNSSSSSSSGSSSSNAVSEENPLAQKPSTSPNTTQTTDLKERKTRQI